MYLVKPGGEHAMLSDDDLTTRAKAGDPAAWRALYQANASRLTVWLRAMPIGDASTDCDDIAATAWLTAAEKIADFSGSSSDFAGWLFGIARNIAMNTRRRSIRRATIPSAYDGDDDVTWGSRPDWTGSVDAADWARQLLKELPPREAEVVACLDIVGFDVSTTAAVIGISSAAVRVSHHRGIQRLRALMSNREAHFGR
jgi:RNA polymerase sigma-70 factor (ECF subfamily)